MIRIGMWNVRIMFRTSKTEQVISEMKRYRLEILGTSECRLTGSGHQGNSDMDQSHCTLDTVISTSMMWPS